MWCPFLLLIFCRFFVWKVCNQKPHGKLLNVFVWIGYVCSELILWCTRFSTKFTEGLSPTICAAIIRQIKPPIRQIPRVAATALSGRELNVNIYRHTNEPVIKKADDKEPGK